MKNRPILLITLILNLLAELIIIILVYNEVGFERLPSQFLRVVTHIILIGFIIFRKSNTALLILAIFHLLTAITHFGELQQSGWIGEIFIIYHIVVGLVIYFHDWFEMKLKIKSA
ncbi:hypothetical protein AR687_08740 [Flavobacteriaceae bacterium CRH]|nr:hypothetical protein AR687_08740 [Flavobacteriaceae bacterium CRH]